MKLCRLEGWKEELVGTKEVDGVKVEALGTKSPDEAAMKGLLGVAGAVNDAVGAHSIGLEGSLHVETSVDPLVNCGEFRSENCD